MINLLNLTFLYILFFNHWINLIKKIRLWLINWSSLFGVITITDVTRKRWISTIHCYRWFAVTSYSTSMVRSPYPSPYVMIGCHRYHLHMGKPHTITTQWTTMQLKRFLEMIYNEQDRHSLLQWIYFIILCMIGKYIHGEWYTIVCKQLLYRSTM